MRIIPYRRLSCSRYCGKVAGGVQAEQGIDQRGNAVNLFEVGFHVSYASDPRARRCAGIAVGVVPRSAQMVIAAADCSGSAPAQSAIDVMMVHERRIE